ncbi:unnamed protein product [Candida verbasci]|uniref:Mitochondrial acidic protein MAM33 n=1 Tax=Candida verbasci TaxID=1227364 RepID=A0A9W4U195_9ASCO|nr:unnamed protein product [Candida verbasci]
MSRLLKSSTTSQLSKRLINQSIKNLKVALPVLPIYTTRQFQTSIPILNKAAESSLNEVIKTELKYNEEIPNELDSMYEDYIKSQNFQVVSKPGQANIELVKKLDNQTIHVYFDIDEVTDIPTEDLELNPEEGDLEDEVSNLDQILCNIKILIENENNTGLFFNLFLQNTESSFMIDYINIENDVTKFKKMVNENNEFIDKFNYQGPKFSELDESLQTEFENYLIAKGVNNELADFIIAFSDFKEENEYRNWLSSISKFLE